MKKLFALLLALSLCFAFVGCVNSYQNEPLPGDYNYFHYKLFEDSDYLENYLEKCGYIIESAKIGEDKYAIHYISQSRYTNSYSEDIAIINLAFIDKFEFSNNTVPEDIGELMENSVKLSANDMLYIVENRRGTDYFGFWLDGFIYCTLTEHLITE